MTELQPQASPATSSEASANELAERERAFYDTKGAGLYRRLRLLIWRAIGEFNRDNELHELYEPDGKRVLLFGCGEGNEVPSLLEGGAASIHGFDVSDAEIERARATAERLGYADKVDFATADAHHTPYPDHSFDLIIGNAILHHLELDLALVEIKRLLAPGGRAVFREPLADNPLLKLGRALTPAARTPDEHPLVAADFATCARHFPQFSHREVELTSIPLMPLNLVVPPARQRRMAERVARLDDRMLERWPSLGRFARSTLITLE